MPDCSTTQEPRYIVTTSSLCLALEVCASTPVHTHTSKRVVPRQKLGLFVALCIPPKVKRTEMQKGGPVNDKQVPTYDDPYPEILNKIIDALNEANLHSHNMNEAEYFIFQAIAFVINEKDPHAIVPELT